MTPKVKGTRSTGIWEPCSLMLFCHLCVKKPRMTEYKVEEHESFIGIMLVWVSRIDMVCFVKEVLNSDF